MGYIVSSCFMFIGGFLFLYGCGNLGLYGPNFSRYLFIACMFVSLCLGTFTIFVEWSWFLQFLPSIYQILSELHGVWEWVVHPLGVPLRS